MLYRSIKGFYLPITNIQAFNHALEELELCKDFGEAKELLLKKYVPKYLWDITSAEAEEFIDIIKRRFN
ncbi:MAG: hypothetical protein MUF45_17050 [Spirosomaceae bacterium]|nr:hypothetical protein [Spirosomataceae bacterium]